MHEPPTGPVKHEPPTGPVLHEPPTGPVQHEPPTGPVQHEPPIGPDQSVHADQSVHMLCISLFCQFYCVILFQYKNYYHIIIIIIY